MTASVYGDRELVSPPPPTKTLLQGLSPNKKILGETKKKNSLRFAPINSPPPKCV